MTWPLKDEFQKNIRMGDVHSLHGFFHTAYNGISHAVSECPGVTGILKLLLELIKYAVLTVGAKRIWEREYLLATGEVKQGYLSGAAAGSYSWGFPYIGKVLYFLVWG